MMALGRSIGTASLGLYKAGHRSWAKAFSLLIAGGFDSFGRATVIEPPVRLDGEQWIAVGSGVSIGAGSWLQVLGDHASAAISIGDGTGIVGSCVLSAAESVTLGRSVLFARNVYIADHQHAFEHLDVPVRDQGIERVAPVVIGDGAWLGQNVVVGPGVSIGQGAVIGANSVVLSDVPDYSVAVGAPARVIRSFHQAPPPHVLPERQAT
jgi:lipopolysaccharide O-acetyltransferase